MELEKLHNDSKRSLESLENKDKQLLDAKNENSRLQKIVDEQKETLKNNENG